MHWYLDDYDISFFEEISIEECIQEDFKKFFKCIKVFYNIK